MMNVLSNNEPRYIEDFLIAGDPTPPVPDGFDWLPVFQRAASEHLDLNMRDPERYQHTYERPIFVGRTRSWYKLSGTLYLVGLRLEGLYPGVELRFNNGTDGIHIHYPKTRAGEGTSSRLPPPLTGYGGNCTLRNLVIRGRKSDEGTRGIIIQKASFLENVDVQNFGWHGFHITADTEKRKIKSDGVIPIDGVISNANGTTLINCRAIGCGHRPGYCDHPQIATGANATGANLKGCRPFGSGLRIEGLDSNCCYTQSFSGKECAHWAIDDVGAAGNLHVLPGCDQCSHIVTQDEVDISTHPNASDDEKRDFRTYDVAVGDRVHFAYHIEKRFAHGILMSPYVDEGDDKIHIVDVRPRSFVIGGINGKYTTQTTRISGTSSGGRFDSRWHFFNKGPYEAHDTTGISDGIGVFISLQPRADLQGVADPNYEPDLPAHPYRLKYVHFKDDNLKEAGRSENWAGFYRLDWANLDRRVALALTDFNSYEKTRGGDLSSPRLLFDINFRPEYQTNLNNSIIPDDLRQEFNSENIPLADKASVTVKEADVIWLITDKGRIYLNGAHIVSEWDRVYIVKKQGGRLEIYLSPKLTPGRLVMLPHYRATDYKHIRRVEYGRESALGSIEGKFPAAYREIGDAYICLDPIPGGIYEAVVINDPQNPGTRIWAKVSEVPISASVPLDFMAPTSVPGSVDRTIQVDGAALGDTVTVGAPIAIGTNYILTAFVSAEDTVTIRWTQITGVPTDPDGVGGTYRVNVWKH